MIVDRLRERHQHAADADRTQFRKRQCAGATDHEIRPGIGRGHVGDERLDACFDTGSGIRTARFIEHLLAGLVQHVHRQAERRDRLRHCIVQCACALAAAQHQQAQCAAVREVALRGRRDLRDLRAHRIADQHFAHEGLREADHDLSREFRQHLVGQPGGAVLFMHQQRDAGDARGDPARPRRIAAEADHRIRPARAQHAGGIADRTQHPQRRRQQGGDALAAQALDRDGVDGDAMLRHQPRFHAAIRTQPCHLRATRTQRLRDREAGEDVAAGAAGQDHHVGRWLAQRDLRKAATAADSDDGPMLGSMRWRRRLVPRLLLDGSVGACDFAGCEVGGGAPTDGPLATPRSLATWRAARSYS